MKFSLSVRIENYTPAHTTLGIFCNLIPSEYEHSQVTRAKAGTIVLRNEEVVPLLKAMNPHIISAMSEDCFPYMETLIKPLGRYTFKKDEYLGPLYHL